MFENLRSDRDKFIVTVTLRDLTQTEGQVRLRLRMESFTHAMQTRRGAQTPIHTLIPGVPLRLTNEDLRVYFLEQNLEFTNMPRNLYRNNATVPEGHYRIWFEVYEARTGAHVSRGSEVAANLHIVQHDVPLINLPQQNATVHLPESGLQHVVFQWAPRHFGPGMLTEYRLQIVEVPPGMNPEQVMHATLVPFFETTTMATSFVFNHTHPPMRLGFTYAFRVQARLRGPDEGMSMFKNNGFTPTQWFTFSQRCPELRNVRVEPINQFAVWVHYMDHPLYERVRFRRRLDQAGSFWHYITGNQNPLLVSELRPEQGYQYQMMAYCAFEYTNWTPIRTFKTPPAPPPLFECGAEDTTPPLVNTGVPLGRPLRQGDVVRLPQNSELRIRESTGTGPFRGYGTVFFNFFNANLIMTFEALEVDDEMQWVSGELISRQSRDGRFIINLDRPQDQPPPTDTTTIETPIIIADNTDITITDSEGNPITENSQPPFTITITNPDGEEQQITVENLPAVITDGSGAEFVVNQDGTVERRQEDLLAGHDDTEYEMAISQVATGLLYVIVREEDKVIDTLFDNHFLTITDKNRSLTFEVRYTRQTLLSNAFHSLEEVYRERLQVPIPRGWDRKIDLDSVKWSISTTASSTAAATITGQRIPFTPRTYGSHTIEIDAGRALPVVFTERDTREEKKVLGSKIPGAKISVALNVLQGGVLRFQPKNDQHYRYYGFDEAIIPRLQQAGDFGESLTIGGIDYYVPRLLVLPNEEAKINIAYTYTLQSSPGIGSNIVLRSNDRRLLINGQRDRIELSTLRKQEVRLQAEVAGTFVVNAYYVNINNDSVLIGRLNVVSRNYTTKTLRIIRVRRTYDEDHHFPFTREQKLKMRDTINYVFRQTFIRFELDNDFVDTLSTNTSSSQRIALRRLYNSYPTGSADHFHIFLASRQKGNYSLNGEAYPLENFAIVYNASSLTAAHELGHNLGLLHTFEDCHRWPRALRTGNRVLERGSTRNIMDVPRMGYVDCRRFLFWYQIKFLINYSNNRR